MYKIESGMYWRPPGQEVSAHCSVSDFSTALRIAGVFVWDGAHEDRITITTPTGRHLSLADALAAKRVARGRTGMIVLGRRNPGLTI